MPRFSQQEKERIYEKLLKEGERLFLTHGIKKVTIDDLAEAVPIAKATFYVFFEHKESLYFQIIQKRQSEIFKELTDVLTNNKNLPNKERVKQVFQTMEGLLLQYPIIQKIDNTTIELLSRKISQNQFDGYANQNVAAVQTMKEHGIQFSCDEETVSYSFQALYHGWLFLGKSKPNIQDKVTNIMLNGIIDQIVLD
jgi:AcrR family transcriptional regulator